MPICSIRALVEDGHAVAHRERLFLVVRDVDEGDAEVLLERLQEHLHLLAQLQVERAERLVEQQHRRRVDDRARERDALALPARELHGLAVAEPGEADALEHLVACVAPLLRATPFTRSPYSTFSATVMCGKSA